MKKNSAIPWRTIIEVAGIGAVGAAARMIHVFGQSTIPDEAFTFWVGAHPLPELLRLVRYEDVHPPLIYVLAHLLFAVTYHAYVFRVVTSAIAVAGVLASYFLARRIVGSYAWLPSLMLALCPLMVFFDRFFRMYALLGCLTVVTWLLLVRAFEAPQRASRWAAYALAAALLLYSHYLGVFTLAAQAVYAGFTHRTEARYWAALAIALVLWIPWLPALLDQLPSGGGAFNAIVGFGTRYSLPGYLLTDGLPYRLEFSFLYLTALWALALGALVAGWQSRYRLALWLLLPVALQLTYAVITGKNLLAPRYLLGDEFAIMIAVSVAIVTLLQSRWRVLGAGIAAGLLMLMTVGAADRIFVPKYMAVDWQLYARFLGANLRPGDAVVFDQGSPWLALSNESFLRHRAVFLITNRRAAVLAAARVVRYPRVWFVDYGSQYTDPDHLIFHALRRTHPRTTTWLSTEEGNLDFVVTTLFEAPDRHQRR